MGVTQPAAPVPATSPAGGSDDDGHRGLLVRAARNGMIGLFGSVVAAVAGLALNVVVGRGFGPVASGVFFVAVAVVTVASTVARLGADTGMVWALPRLRQLGRPEGSRRVLAVACVPVVLVSLAAGTVIYLLAGDIARAVVSDGEVAQTTLLLHVAAPLVALTAPTLVVAAGLRGAGQLRAYTLVQNVLIAGTRPLLVLAVALAGLQLVAALWAWGAPVAVALVVGVLLFLRATRVPAEPAEPAPPRPVGQSAREFWRFSAARSVSALLEVAIVWADVLIVSAVTGSRQAGIYAAASRFITTGTLFEAAMRVALSAALSARLAVGDLVAVARLHLASTQWIILLSWPLYIALAAYAPAVLRLFGPGFAEGADAMSLLCLAMLVAMATGNSQTVLLMSGRSGWQLANKIVAIAVNLGLNAVLVPTHGIIGAAWAWTATILVDSTQVVIQVRYLVGVRIPGVEVVRAMVVAAASFGVVGLLVRWLTDLSAMTVLGAVLLSCALHLAVLRSQRRHFNDDVLRLAVRRRQATA